jgi:hypothetical protein
MAKTKYHPTCDMRISVFCKNYRYRNLISKVSMSFKGEGSMEEIEFD